MITNFTKTSNKLNFTQIVEFGNKEHDQVYVTYF